MLRFQCSLHLLQPSSSANYNNHSNICFHNFERTIQVPKIQRVRADWYRRSVKARVNGLGIEMDEEEEEEDGLTSRKRESYRGRKKEEDINYDKDPEFADILGDCLDNPEKAQKKVQKEKFIIYIYIYLSSILIVNVLQDVRL